MPSSRHNILIVLCLKVSTINFQSTSRFTDIVVGGHSLFVASAHDLSSRSIHSSSKRKGSIVPENSWAKILQKDPEFSLSISLPSSLLPFLFTVALTCFFPTACVSGQEAVKVLFCSLFTSRLLLFTSSTIPRHVLTCQRWHITMRSRSDLLGNGLFHLVVTDKGPPLDALTGWLSL